MTDRQLLDLRLCDLPVRIKGSQLEQRIDKLYHELDARSLSFRPHIWLAEEWFTPDGVAGLIDEARRLGLLSDKTDYTGGQPMPGARLAQLQLIVDGITYNLTGNPDLQIECVRAPCDAAPGTPEAFAAYWQELTMAETWLDSELGPSQQYVPDRVALLLTPPTEQGMPNRPVDWPYDTPLAQAGVDYPGETGDRCVTLSGDALAAIWPTLRDGNQLNVFVDGAGTLAAPVVRVLVPGDDSPCPDGG
jgi:hypothetical protein